MQVSLFTVFVSFYALCGITAARVIPADADDDQEDESGYYWRDFTGNIPKDALPGGKNVNGKTTYIGQVLHTNQLIPAKIDPEEKNVYYEWGYKEYEASKNIKILCTKHPEQFEWIKTGNGRINTITDKKFVEGGYEEGVTILIGRKQLEDELSVGKIVSSTIQSTLNITKDGFGNQFGDFEVLTYNPNIKITKQKKKKDEKTTVIEDELNQADQGVSVKPPDAECKSNPIIINIYNNK